MLDLRALFLLYNLKKSKWEQSDDGLATMNFLAVESCRKQSREETRRELFESLLFRTQTKISEEELWRTTNDNRRRNEHEKCSENHIKNYDLMWHILISITLIRIPLNDLAPALVCQLHCDSISKLCFAWENDKLSWEKTRRLTVSRLVSARLEINDPPELIYVSLTPPQKASMRRFNWVECTIARRARERLLNLNTGKIDHNSIELTKKAFFALTNIYASKHAARCVCIIRLFGYQNIKQQINCIMQLPYCCEIFDIFIFLATRPRAKQRIPRCIFNFSLFTACLPAFHSMLHSFRTPLVLLLCAFAVDEMQFRWMQHEKCREKCKNTEHVRQF